MEIINTLICSYNQDAQVIQDFFESFVNGKFNFSVISKLSVLEKKMEQEKFHLIILGDLDEDNQWDFIQVIKNCNSSTKVVVIKDNIPEDKQDEADFACSYSPMEPRQSEKIKQKIAEEIECLFI